MVRLMKREFIDNIMVDVVACECDTGLEAQLSIPPADIDDGIYFVEGNIGSGITEEVEPLPF